MLLSQGRSVLREDHLPCLPLPPLRRKQLEGLPGVFLPGVKCFKQIMCVRSHTGILSRLFFTSHHLKCKHQKRSKAHLKLNNAIDGEPRRARAGLRARFAWVIQGAGHRTWSPDRTSAGPLALGGSAPKQRIPIKPFSFWGTQGAGFLKASKQKAVLSHVCVGRPNVSVKGRVSTSRLTLRKSQD